MLALSSLTIALGVISLILGIVFFFGKEGPKALESFLNKLIVKIPPAPEKHYKILGALLIIMAAVLFFVVFTYKLV